MQDIKSFEVQGTPYDQESDTAAMLKQLAEEFISEHAGYNFQIIFMGDRQAVITLHVCEIWAPSVIQSCMKATAEASDRLLNDYEKTLRKQFKSRTGKTLKLKETKDDRATSVERVSLNDRYYFRSSRTYTI